MANKLTIRKVTALPGTLEASCLYLVKSAIGSRLTAALTDSAGSVVYKTMELADVTSLINTTVFDAQGDYIVEKMPPIAPSEPLVIAATDKTAQASASARLFYENFSLRESLGVATQFQPAFHIQEYLGDYDHIMFWQPPGDAATATTATAVSTRGGGSFGMDNLSVTGTLTARATAATNLTLYQRRVGFVSAATAAALCGFRIPSAQLLMGSTTNTDRGGFYWTLRFSPSDAAAVANARCFAGITAATTAPTNVEPSTLVNCMGVGHRQADTNWFIFYGGSAAQTPIDTGIPVQLLSTQSLYELSFLSLPGSNTVTWFFRKMGGATATGTLSGVRGTALPSVTTLLTPLNVWRTNNGTLLAVALDGFKFYCRQFYQY